MKRIILKPAGPAQPAFPHDVIPDDDPEPGDRCKRCGDPITWIGPSLISDWQHVKYEAQEAPPEPAYRIVERTLMAQEFGVHNALVQGDDLAPGDDRGEDRCPNCNYTRYAHVESKSTSEGAFGWTCQREPRGSGADPFGRTKEDWNRHAE